MRLGVPEMTEQWEDFSSKAANATLGKDEEKLYKKWGKAMVLLANDPQYPGLHSHKIDALSRRYSEKVLQSYLENRNSKTARMYWVYGPKKGEITIIQAVLIRKRDSYPAASCERRFQIWGMNPSYNKFPCRANDRSSALNICNVPPPAFRYSVGRTIQVSKCEGNTCEGQLSLHS
jgi:hypothetical protein